MVKIKQKKFESFYFKKMLKNIKKKNEKTSKKTVINTPK